MVIQDYPDLLKYVVNKASENSGNNGSFLHHFFKACLYADAENFELIKPVLERIMAKYPVYTDPNQLRLL